MRISLKLLKIPLIFSKLIFILHYICLLYVFTYIATFKTYKMEAIGITELRKNIKTTLNKIVDDGIEIIIHRPNQDDVVMISLNEYNSLNETLKLLSSKTNRERLYLGMEQVNKGQTTSISLDEL